VSAVAIAGAGLFAGTAIAGDPPHRGKQIPNLTDVKNDITAYYDSGNANREQWRVAHRAMRHLKHRVGHGAHRPAITLDIDDTVLETYSYEQTEDFGYDADTSLKWELAEKQTVIPATRHVVRWAHKHHVKVFYITGRRESKKMRSSTLGNLRKEGFPTPDGLYLRPVDDKDPSAVPYKAGARKEIWKKKGYRILGNFGDQWSDLRGGWSERTYKLPNPMYSLP